MGIESASEKREREEREARERRDREEREERERIHRNKLYEIDSFKNSQDIGTFLRLIDKFIRNYDDYYAIKTLEALEESKIIRNYPIIELASEKNIEIIKKCVYEKFKESQSENYLRKLLIILMLYERKKSYYGINNIYEKCTDEGLKKIFFNILLKYDESFGDSKIFTYYSNYKDFALYALNQNEFYYSLKYCQNSIWQLKMINDLSSKIFNNYYYSKIYFYRLDSYEGAKEAIQNLIQIEKRCYDYKIIFPQTFWENYYDSIFNKYYTIKDKIKNLLSLYDLYVLYIDVGGESRYKYTLANKIHVYVIGKIKDSNESRTQLELLLEYSPYYIYEGYERDPDIFRYINILNMYKKNIDKIYFKNHDFEYIYKNLYKEYIEIIVSRYINDAKELNIILELVEINSRENKKIYIELLINKYYNFKDEKLTH